MKDYSQFGEYYFLKKYFLDLPDNQRVLVDVGAYGKEGSNSYNLLVEDGWSGILIEPCERSYNQVVYDFQDLPVKILNCAISNYSGEGILYKSLIGDGHNSLIKHNHMVSEQNCFVKTLPQVLEENNVFKDFGLLSVDAEGNDCLILDYLLSTSDWRPKIIICEDSDTLFLKYYKYTVIKILGVNKVYVYKI